MPGRACHEIARAPDSPGALVIAALWVVERRFLEDVESKRAFAADALREARGQVRGSTHTGRTAPDSCRAFSRSASAIMFTRPSNVTFGDQPSSRFALDASPSRMSTSAGRK